MLDEIVDKCLFGIYDNIYTTVTLRKLLYDISIERIFEFNICVRFTFDSTKTKRRTNIYHTITGHISDSS